MRDFTSNLGDRTGLTLRNNGSAAYGWTGTHGGSEDVFWGWFKSAMLGEMMD